MKERRTRCVLLQSIKGLSGPLSSYGEVTISKHAIARHTRMV